MLLLFPYRTDAPVYHFPYATIGLIAANAAVLLATAGMSDKELAPCLLQYGTGLHPGQWVTSNFLHAGVVHLAGNMVVLWTFGLLAEGKVGSLAFLLLYLGLGFVQCGAEQLAMARAGPGGSLGASAILFGLMAVALVWAPRNDVSVTGLLILRPFEFDAPIVTFAGPLFLWEAAQIPLEGFTVSTAVLHMSGAVIGTVVGAALVKLGWVDCEGWDLFAVLAGTAGR